MAGRLKIEYRDPRRIKPARRNSRTHSKTQIEQIAASIMRFGFTNPLLIDEKDVLIAGAGRREAALLLELDQVPVIVLRGMSDAKKRELLIADNKIAANAGWDAKLLTLELRDLQKAADFDGAALGYSDRELKGLLDGVRATDAPAQYQEGWAVVVEVADERAQIALLKRLKKEGFTCKALIA